MIRKSIFVLLSFPILLTASINSKTGTTGAAFFIIGPGAKAVGMGSAFTAVCNDATAIYWNPAGMTSIKNKEAIFMHNEWLLDIKYEFLSYVQKFKNNNQIGIGIIGLYMDPMEITLNTGEITNETFTANDKSLILSYARKVISSLSLGISGKYVFQELDKEKADGIMADLGMLYQLQLLDKPLNLGISILNLGYISKFIQEKQILPTRYVFGLMYNLHKDMNNDVKISLDIVQPNDGDLKIHTGIEYWFGDIFAIRVGYRKGYDLGNFTAGLGFKYEGEKNNYELDYAFVNYDQLDKTHQVSFTCKFN